MIVKVLRGFNGDRPLAFVRDKSFTKELHMTIPLLAKLGSDHKGYFKAAWTDGGKTLEIGDRIEDQDW